MRTTALSLTLFLVAAGALAAPADPAAIDRIVAEAHQLWRIPGLAVAVVQDDKVIFLKGYGVRELGRPEAVTPDTLFQIASTTKAFTTTAMALLVDEKKMSWDDPVRKYIPWFQLSDPCADSLVTLRDIVSHRTGLKRHDELWDYGTGSREAILRQVSSLRLNKPFRSAYQYQNIMFMAAGEALASAAGMPWDEFLKRRILDPIGMRSTVVRDTDWQRAERASAHNYDSDDDSIKVLRTLDYEALGPAGSMKSSARDMAQWLRFQLNEGRVNGRQIISAAALQETKSPHTVIPFDESSRRENPETNINTYALGWRVQDYRGELLVHHGGALNRFRSQVALLPRQRAGIVVLSNVNRGYGGIAIRHALADLILGKGTRDWNAHFLAIERKAVEDAAKDRAEVAGKRRKDTRPSRELAAYVGTYEHPAYGPVAVREANGGLMLEWQRLRVPLTHYHFDTFSGELEEEDFDERIPFALDAEGEVRSLRLFGEEFLRKKSPA